MVVQAIKSIELMSALKVGAVAGAIMGVIYGLFGMVIIAAIGSMAAAIPALGSLAMLSGLGIIAGVVVLIVAIILGAICGGIYGVIMAAIYNYIIAKISGGLKIDLQ